jgi:inward rectifier potassium channel
MANFRANNVVEANLRVTLMRTVRTREGEQMRQASDVPLVRGSTSLFLLSWTALHKIDESSPFFSPESRQKLRDEKAELFLSFTGVDETIAAQIHSRYRYTMDDVAENARFVDILSLREDGKRVLDYEHFHDILKDDITGGEY